MFFVIVAHCDEVGVCEGLALIRQNKAVAERNPSLAHVRAHCAGRCVKEHRPSNSDRGRLGLQPRRWYRHRRLLVLAEPSSNRVAVLKLNFDPFGARLLRPHAPLLVAHGSIDARYKA